MQLPVISVQLFETVSLRSGYDHDKSYDFEAGTYQVSPYYKDYLDGKGPQVTDSVTICQVAGKDALVLHEDLMKALKDGKGKELA